MTNKYSLRLIRQEDYSAFHTLVNNNLERLKDFFAGTVAANKTLSDSEAFVIDALKRHSEGTYFPYIISDNSGTLIGYIDVKNIDTKAKKAELGVFIDSAYSSNGIVTQCLRRVIKEFFLDHHFEKMYLRTHESNTAARKIASRLGFTEEGRLRKDYMTSDGVLVDLIYYGILKNEYKDH